MDRNDATTQRERQGMHENEIAEGVVEAAFRVHRWFGPGLLEGAYEACLAHELIDMGFTVEQQVPLPLVYRNVRLDVGYRLDIWVDRKLIVEVKAVDGLHPCAYGTDADLPEVDGLQVGFTSQLPHRSVEGWYPTGSK